jgi:LacI family transcriptional regulator
VDVVVQDPDELGRRAATLLFDRLAGSTEAPRRITLPTRLLTRS